MERLDSLFAAKRTTAVTAEGVEAMRHQLSVYEKRYNTPSDKMHTVTAFHDLDGEIVETDDLIAWSSLYVRYKALAGS